MVRTRIAPSPTGQDIHIGNLYTALMNWAYARKNNGKFIIRIEDTDRTRFQEGAEAKILSTIKNFGLRYDEGPDIGGPFAPYRQSDRLQLYKKYAEELVEKGAAYYCFCTKERLDALREQQQKEKKTPRYDKHCKGIKDYKLKIENSEQHVIRLDVPANETITFLDVIRGEIAINSNEVDDQVLLKSDGFPTYHLGVVVDDYLMEISHIIRAEEWIASTPKHVLLYQALGWPLPIFAHMPILRNPDKSKLSKRKNPVWASWYLEEGFLPEAVLNYLALLGWSHPKEKEIFSISEFIEFIDLKDIKPVGPVFDLIKLRWVNQQYIQNKSDEELKALIISFYPKAKELSDKILDELMPLVKTRMEVLKDFETLTKIFFASSRILEEVEKDLAKDLFDKLSALFDWESDMIFGEMKKVMEIRKIRMPVLYKLFTGEERGLPLPQVLEILGKEKTLSLLNLNK
ncbi:glutamate--tRNA ligase [Candidatus Roizmanbacteria bacterium]|nr:glutamate--tRNA ligase [Candidatus Roizmanbacteria bacterium]